MIWLDYQDKILYEDNYLTGEEEPSYKGDEPTRPDDNKYTYEFIGWDEGTVDGNTTTYRPIFKKTIIPHTHDWQWIVDEAPTCDKEGKRHQKCSICDATQSHNTPIEKAPHVWKDDPSFAFSEDSSKILATFTCDNDPSHTTAVEAEICGDTTVILPTETEDGKYVYPVMVIFESKEYKGTVEETIARAQEGTYSYDGDPVTWTNGSGEGAKLHFVRSEHDDITFDAFTGLKVDGKAVDKKNYTAESGSVTVTLSADYLETLTEGTHTVRAEFTDGNAETVLTVKDVKVPATDAEDHTAVYAWTATLSIISLAAVLIRRKRYNA